MRKKYWMFTLTLVAVIFLVEYDLAHRVSQKNRAMNSLNLGRQPPQAANLVHAGAASESSGATSAQPDPVAQGIAATRAELSPFESQFLKEAQKISQLQSNPQAADQKLDQLAHTITPTDLKKLAAVMENKNQDGDERAMAVELLSRAGNADAVEALRDFVLTRNESSGSGFSREHEFESVLRAQAIEGIAAYPEKDLALSQLSALSEKVDDTFLKDRIVRSEENLKGRAPTTQQQDDAALRQLVE